MAAAVGSAPCHTFDFGPGSLRGYAMYGPGSEIAVQHMANSPYVDFIQPDTKISLANAPIDAALHVNENNSYSSNPTESWGLHRVSHGFLQAGEPLEYRRNSTGRNAWVYVLDSGIELSHPQFGGVPNGDAHSSETDEDWIPTGGDDFGHGTHVAGIIGGSSLGVAQETNLVAVKVFNSMGGAQYDVFVSNVMRALQWVIDDARKYDRLEKSVINMSFGGLVQLDVLRPRQRDVLQMASQKASAEGIFVVASAGNLHVPTVVMSPAGEPEVCAVGAIDRNDTRAWFSNYSPGVDLLAPGVEVLSAWRGNKTRLLDGTSMAAPFVAGLGAYFMELDGPGKSYPGYKMCERLKAIGSYQKGAEGLEAPANCTDVYNNYTRVASNGWGW
ncbi:endopeptidase K [Apiospora kogelbergensis]|uniref:endopeptidase K n=1 Tax=Apiospora kogelbergensis TaxID=1337665 RepID=UPI003130FC75